MLPATCRKSVSTGFNLGLGYLKNLKKNKNEFNYLIRFGGSDHKNKYLRTKHWSTGAKLLDLHRPRKAPIKSLIFLASLPAKLCLESPSSSGQSNVVPPTEKILSSIKNTSVMKNEEGTRSRNLWTKGFTQQWLRTRSSLLGRVRVSSSCTNAPPRHSGPSTCATLIGNPVLRLKAIDLTSAAFHSIFPGP